MTNTDLGKTKITDLIRVSSAAIVYDNSLFPYVQYETFIFSGDSTIKTRQIIHGTSSGTHRLVPGMVEKTMKIHKQISDNLLNLNL